MSKSPAPPPVQWLDETDEQDFAQLAPTAPHPLPSRWMWLLVLPLLYLVYLAGASNQTSKPPSVGPFVSAPASSPQSTSTPKSHATVTIHVVGAVRKPGVYEFGSDARVRDAVRKAQPKADANLEAINLAAFLEDGKQLVVPGKAEPMPVSRGIIAPQEGKVREETRSPVRASAPRRTQSLVSQRHASRAAATASEKQSTLAPKSIDLNTASLEELQQLPGVGPATAEKIVEYRDGHNGFGTVDELDEVKGIGPKKLDKLRPFATVR